MGREQENHPVGRSAAQTQHEPGQSWLTLHPLVPGWLSLLFAGGIQSPYVHRASGLAQIAVSTMLRTDCTANRELLYAEHCRYGSGDFGIG
jgi:hypothetical protein